MSKVHVVVTSETRDLHVEGIARAVSARDDMVLAGGAACSERQVAALLSSVPSGCPFAVIHIGMANAGASTAWLERFSGLVVLEVDLTPHGPAVRLERFASRHTKLDGVLSALKELIEGQVNGQRVSQVKTEHPRLDAFSVAKGKTLHLHLNPNPPDDSGSDGDGLPECESALAIGLAWLHECLLVAIAEAQATGQDERGANAWLGLGTHATAVQQAMQTRQFAADAVLSESMVQCRSRLSLALASSDAEDDCRLARLFHRLGLTQLELEFCLLMVAPDLEPRLQRCLAVLQDDASRRVGSGVLYASLLGDPIRIRAALLASGGLQRWRLFENSHVGFPAADDPVRADSQVFQWLLGATLQPELDTTLQRILAVLPWQGTSLLGADERFLAHGLLQRLDRPTPDQSGRCVLVLGDHPAYGRALLEWGAQLRSSELLRVPADALAGLPASDLLEAATRLARASLLTDRPIVLDGCDLAEPQTRTGLSLLLGRLSALHVNSALIARQLDDVLSSVADVPFELHHIEASPTRRMAWAKRGLEMAEGTLVSPGAVQEAATRAAQGFPLQIDGFELAMRAARAASAAQDTRLNPARSVSPLDGQAADSSDEFIAQCRRVAVAGVSRLADCIEPRGRLEDIVLPADRRDQLNEIIASVRLSSAVMDGWRFGHHLPYGRGTTALFHGPSGTGKTMAAHAIASALQVHLLRIDLSRVVSKYIGETEKHCDQVFADATRSGAAVLIDEADALFGKRSEVKDAHDRYANIEVAFLLQRIEQFDGLAILTSNLRQNIDQAFLRRLRFIVDFPRPDLDARLRIWHACLPDGSHQLGEVDFRDIAARVDLTGGHIRQITLRAAFMAADRGELIELRHLKAAARAELAKLGLPAMGLDQPQLSAARKVA